MNSPRPLRFRYSLRTLWIVVTVCALLGGLGWNLHRVQQRREFLSMLGSRGALFGRVTGPAKSLPLAWRWLGAEPIGLIELPDDSYTDDELARLGTLFPESVIRHHIERIDRPQFRAQPLKER